MTVGEQVKALRGERNLSQFELAVRSGLTPSTISKIERDETRPTRRTRRDLAAALEVDEEMFRKSAAVEESSL